MVLLVHLQPPAVLVVLVVGLALVPLRLLVRVQAVEPPALLLLHANWEVLVLQADWLHVAWVDEPPGKLHWSLGHPQYATEMIIPDFRVWCPELEAQEFVVIAPTMHRFEHVTRLANL